VRFTIGCQRSRAKRPAPLSRIVATQSAGNGDRPPSARREQGTLNMTRPIMATRRLLHYQPPDRAAHSLKTGQTKTAAVLPSEPLREIAEALKAMLPKFATGPVRGAQS
jgi:hypothetical protein